MASPSEREKFILEKHREMEAPEIASHLAISLSLVLKIYRKLDIKPLTKRERHQKFILAHHKEMSATQVADILGINRKTLISQYGNPLGITFKTEEEHEKWGTRAQEIERENKKNKQQPNSCSPRTILAGFQFGTSHHYHAPEMDPVEQIREKLRKEFKDKL